jgi:hypothetical protein
MIDLINQPPRGALPQRRVILVAAAVSSMKVSRFGSRVGCAFRKASRAATPSPRSCSAARTLFFLTGSLRWLSVINGVEDSQGGPNRKQDSHWDKGPG